MGVKRGYKQTEVGVIPEDWEVRKIGHIADIKTGPFGTVLKASEYSRHNGVPLISVGEIREGFLRVTDETPRVSENVTTRLPQYLLKEGDIVFGRKGGIERSGLVLGYQNGWFLGSDGISIRPIKELFAEYLAAQFQSHRVKVWLYQNATGTTMASLSQGILQNVCIPLPPTKAEQTAIADALSDADALIESLGRLIAKKRQIKQGAMQELLTGKRRLPGFSGEWSKICFGNIVAVRNLKVLPRQIHPETTCIELEHISQRTGTILGNSEATSLNSAKYLFEKGDVLFGRLRPYLRKFWHADREGVCSTEIWPLKADSNQIYSKFLRQIVETDTFIETTSVSYGTHMPRADWNVVRNFQITIPKLSEQTAIANILSDMDEEIATLETKLTKARQIKQAMMQELLTGKIRLI